MFWDNLPVPSSRVKQDSGGKNYHSTLHKVPKDCRSHVIVDYTFTAKPVLFLIENLHCQAIMLQEAVNNCLRCIKCAEASYSGLLWMCVLPHLLPRGIPFVLGYKKNKSQLIVWKIIPARSTEAYCRQHILKMQVKLHTYHWGIQWNSMVMQVKKATFQRMKSGGKGRTENRWEVSGAGELHHRKYVLYFHSKYIKKSQWLTVRATTDLFLVTL